MTRWDGLLLIDKPVGPTSHDLVARARRICGTRRVGHAGTLDPAASGLLPLVLGRATRFVRFLHHSPKCYEGQFVLGLTTSSDDITGETLERFDGPLPRPAAVALAANGLVGPLDQVPPRVSARKIGGKRMYALARKGIDVVAPPRAVEVFRFSVEPLTENEAGGEYRFRAEVTAGTYIRSLVRDLGCALGCGGTLSTLRRTSIGPEGPGQLHVSSAVPVPVDGPEPTEDDFQAALVPLDRMPLDLPDAILADEELARRFSLGQTVPAEAGWPEGLLGARSPTRRLLGVGDAGGGVIRPRVVVPVD